ncbi:SusD/RagB family nutrient-binding outer membrane lipoprotein [Rapidithrix thailandica]|uniref:SusD/RagB family nutrient-binding outer membrane lipoprotein n=1 Tax=Rapidithrix thailandica TaxID=413964 RepID=A0AAW9SCA7_9BACT
MKRKYNLSLKYLLGTLLLLCMSCEEGFEDLSKNPNQPLDVEAKNLISSIEASMAYEISYRANTQILNLWVQHMAASQYPEEDQYVLRDGDINNIWNMIYNTPLNDAQVIVDKGTELQNNQLIGIGKVLKVFLFSYLSDLFGDIPFSEALQGSPEKGDLLTPKYDDQSTLYPQLITELDEALASLDQFNPDLSSNINGEDLMFGGDVGLWKRFANSLKLRLWMRLSEKDENAAKAAIMAMDVSDMMEDNLHTAKVVFLNNNGNATAAHLTGRDQDFRLSKTLADYMIGNGTRANPEDPRLPVYATPTPDNNDYVGIPNGMKGLNSVKDDDGSSFTFKNTSQLGQAFLQRDSPMWIMTYAEVLFLQAEAAQRWGAFGGDAKALYEKAVMASASQYNITDMAKVADLLNGTASYDDAADKLALIMTQKWVALFTQGNEAFADWRRTGLPALSPSVDNLNEDKIPRRLPYPTEEFSVNKSNIDAAIANQGEAGYNGRVWWDQP